MTLSKEEIREKRIKNLKPFVKGDPRINRAGAPKRGQSWAEVWKRLTDMTREELIEYIGPTTKMGKLLKELPPDIPIKDGLAVITMIAYGREPNARMLAAIMDREDGKPAQPIVGGDQPVKVLIEYSDNQTPKTASDAIEDKE